MLISACIGLSIWSAKKQLNLCQHYDVTSVWLVLWQLYISTRPGRLGQNEIRRLIEVLQYVCMYAKGVSYRAYNILLFF